jgi:hypothetical protein
MVELMSDSTLVWRDSSDKIKEHHQFSIYLGLFVINFFLVLFILGFIMSGNFLIIIMIILLLILDILQFKNRKVQPFEIYTDKIIYAKIKYGSTEHDAWTGPDIKKKHAYFSSIEKIGEIEYAKPSFLQKEIFGSDYKVKIFRISFTSGRRIILTDRYLTDIEKANKKLKHQLERFKLNS